MPGAPQERSDVLRAGLIAAIFSGAPSTIHALATGRPLLESTAAAGSLVLRDETRTSRLVVAAIPAHVGLSVFWAAAIARALPRKRPILAGSLFGLGIGVFDLIVVGRRVPRIDALPLGPQLADHALFGALVAAMTKR